MLFSINTYTKKLRVVHHNYLSNLQRTLGRGTVVASNPIAIERRKNDFLHEALRL